VRGLVRGELDWTVTYGGYSVSVRAGPDYVHCEQISVIEEQHKRTIYHVCT